MNSLVPAMESRYKEVADARGIRRSGETYMTGLAETTMREVMDIRQASEYLGVSGDTLYRYATDGFIPAFKLGNRWRFRKSLVDAWMDEKSGIRPTASKLTMMSREKKPAGRTRHG